MIVLMTSVYYIIFGNGFCLALNFDSWVFIEKINKSKIFEDYKIIYYIN